MYILGCLNFTPLHQFKEKDVLTLVWSFKDDVQVHSLVQEKMEGISIEVRFYTFCWSSFHKHLLIPMQVNEDDLTDVQAVIDGPPGTPYQGDLSTYSSIKYISNKICTPCKGDDITVYTQIYTKYDTSWKSPT